MKKETNNVRNAGRKQKFEGEKRMLRILVPIGRYDEFKRILNEMIMKTLVLLLFVALVSCEIAKEDEVNPQLPTVKTLSKSYVVDFKFTSRKLTGDVWTNGVFDYNVATTLVEDNYSLNDTASGQLYKINFEYSFKSNKVNNLFFNIKNVIPRFTDYWYVATIAVDGVVVVSDSIYGGDRLGKEIHLNYVIEK